MARVSIADLGGGGGNLYQWGKRRPNSVVAYTATDIFDFHVGASGVQCMRSVDAGSSWALAADLGIVGIASDYFFEPWASDSLDPIVHAVAHRDSGSRGFYYARFSLATGLASGAQALKTWGTQPNAGHTSVCVDEAGDLHAFGRGPTIGGDAGPWHFYSDDGGETWTDTRSMSFTPTLDIRDMFYAWPDLSGDPGDVMAVHGDFSAGGALYLHRYDHSADTWSTTTIDASFDYGETNAVSSPVGFAWDRANGRLFVFGVHANDVSPATLKAWHIVGSTVTAMTDVVTETYLRATSGSFVASSERLYCFYAYDPNDSGDINGDNKGVFYKYSDDLGDTWSDEEQYSSAADLNIHRIITDPNPYVDVVAAVYQNRGGSDYIEAPVLEVGETPEPTIYRLMLATVEAPDTPSLNITPESIRAR